MRKALTTVVLAAVAAMAFGGISLASAQSTGDPSMHTLRLLEKQTASRYVDLGKKGFSLGDEFMFRSALRDLADTHTVGHVQGVCVVTIGGRADCNGTAWLPGGSLRFGQTIPPEAQDTTIAITGGTGRLAGVGGQVRSHSLNHAGTRSIDTIQLMMP